MAYWFGDKNSWYNQKDRFWNNDKPWWEDVDDFLQSQSAHAGRETVYFNPDKTSMMAPKNIADRVYEKGYDPEKSWLPLYDELFRYKDRLKMMNDLAEHGIEPAYASRRPDFGNLAQHVQSLGGEARKVLYKTGNLYNKM